MSQQKEDFAENAMPYFQGVPATIVPDNLKSMVIKSSRFEPTINENFADIADHYGTTILPPRALSSALCLGMVEFIVEYSVLLK